MRPVSSSTRGASPGNGSEWLTVEKVVDLHQRGFVSDAQLAAVKSGEPRAIAKADREALELVKEKSKPTLTLRQSDTINTVGEPGSPRAVRAEEAGKRPGTETRCDKSSVKEFEAKGFVFAAGTSGRNKCAITSLLKDITEKDREGKQAGLKTYSSWMRDVRGDRNNAADNDADNLAKPVKHDNAGASFKNIKTYLGQIEDNPKLLPKNLCIEIWKINQNDGECMSRSIGNGATKLILLQRADRFEAVIPPVRPRAGQGIRSTDV